MTRFPHKLLLAVVALAIVAMVVPMAMAQPEQGRRGRGGRDGAPGGQGGGFGGPPNMARLATLDQVQSVLKLSDDQKEKIKKLNDDMRAEMRKMFDAGGRFDREKMQKMGDENSSKMNEILDEGQRKRLMGIYVQVAGAGAVRDPAVAKELNVTDDQKTKLRDVMSSGRDGGGNQSMEERRAKRDKDVMAVLTKEQQEKLESLKGEKIDIDISKLQGGPGGGRGSRSSGRQRPNRGVDQPNKSSS